MKETVSGCFSSEHSV